EGPRRVREEGVRLRLLLPQQVPFQDKAVLRDEGRRRPRVGPLGGPCVQGRRALLGGTAGAPPREDPEADERKGNGRSFPEVVYRTIQIRCPSSRRLLFRDRAVCSRSREPQQRERSRPISERPGATTAVGSVS